MKGTIGAQINNQIMTTISSFISSPFSSHLMSCPEPLLKLG